MTFAVTIGNIQIPRGFRGQLAFSRILQDEVDLAITRVVPEILQALRNETIPFRGVTRLAWKAEGPFLLPGRRQFQVDFVNDGGPIQQTGGIIASTFEQTPRARPHRPPLTSRGDGRDLTDWVRQVLPTAFSGESTLGMQERAINRVAYAIRQKIGQRGLPSPSNQGQAGKFNRAVESRLVRVEKQIEGAVSKAIARWAEEDV